MCLQLWTEILTKYPQPRFTRKSMHHMWSKIVRKEYELEKDDVKSAALLLEKGRIAGALGTYRTEPIPMDFVSDMAGFTVLAWALPDMLAKWASRIRETSMDSACESNYVLLTSYTLNNTRANKRKAL